MIKVSLKDGSVLEVEKGSTLPTELWKHIQAEQ